MKKVACIVILLICSIKVFASDYIWSHAVPKQVHIIPNGLVLIGEFDNTGISCATGSQAIYLPKTDDNFDAKLSLALTAKATAKEIKVLLLTEDSTCYQVSAHGYVPVVHPYYWQLKN
ncbi:hypothetical protein CJF42_25515 [Pseudoalteromonas sp. NBT06-2]|uniref:hypothetical protein n=1 Tax=Pseudoalteromonas sp. NBT06-2 TaxID=2025950 RepID=UPI000BA6D607|nr:hypothetical protein [Pseudoalteromonas sp. NBT06-2]PAJ71662.1 hypothetical protein CJF42_25515 [Pseudoalteromonas sp. NBT06-2]